MSNEDMRGQLLAASIHEIKNRCGLMFGELDSILDSLTLTNDQQQHVQQIKSESQFVGNELVRILASYKSLSDDFFINIDQHFAIELLEEVIARHTYTTAAHGLSFTLDCDEEVSGFFDNSILFIILDTCIYNSVKAGAKHITLSSHEDEQNLYLCITDDGPGFPEDMLENDFSQGSISMDSQSTGLGLFFANKLIRSHQEGDKLGEIRLSNQSAPKQGAKVTLLLPL
ncbi:hypothetical protein A9Q99_01275 [Gammaproteobacteria bacterium 45_16_T64]|nr:hypothetical protein A9Q99_01275 [Gammaproteobacteria bacterium 45_16_T64]